MPEKPMDGSEPVEPVVESAVDDANDAKFVADASPVEAEDITVEAQSDAPAPIARSVVSAPASMLAAPVAVPIAVTVEPKTRKSAAATIRLEKKHPLAIRWMHWVNFPVLFTMIWSGLVIYWNDSENGWTHPHEVYRVGVGSLTLVRLFPPWFWRALSPFRVTDGLGYHFFFMWIFAINGILYTAYLLISGEWRLLVPERRSLRDAIQVTLVDLHLRKGFPPQKKYNAAQRIAYSAVIVMGLGSLVTGLAIYKPTQAHWVTMLLGGYEMARWEHFWLTMGFCGCFAVHVVQVALAGWNNFRSMVSGYEIVPAAKAPLERERRAR